jgi:membrane protein DedA with SNARE-associated domain
MIESMGWLQNFALDYPILKYLAVYLSTAFGGEFGPIAFAFLLAQDFIKFTPFIVFSFFGALSADILWFTLGKTQFAHKLLGHRHVSRTVFVITEAVRKVSRGSHLLAIIFTKFLIGTRVVLILYISRTNIKFSTFILYDTIATIIWLTIVASIGYLSGLGFTYLSGVIENVYAGIGFVLLVLFGFVLAQMWLKKAFTKEGEEILEKENL